MQTCSRCRAEVAQLRRDLCNSCDHRDRKAGVVVGYHDAEGCRRKITTLMEEHGWAYNEIARAAGVDRSLIAQVVNGRKRVQTKTHDAITGIDPDTRDQ